MLFVELLVPKGMFDEWERRVLAGRLTARRLLSPVDGTTPAADPGVMDLFDSLSHVVVREEEVWIAGGNLLDGSQDPWYVVNVIVGLWGKEMSEHLISRITAELAEAEGRPEPRVVVNVISLPEGGYGLRGRVRRSSDFLALIEEAKTGSAAHVPDGMVVDPVCGATVPLEEAVILERDGQTYGFCCPHCRGHFVRESSAAGAS
ncbi:YHS domain-containing protein [Microbispora catharanthi]|uniref:YHS domain-containing protein n=1 Tax=Microbispora catharanthi TaxID=1712871 RepID=A0A5N6BQ34_9ACTN|nr:YHS domain-containing protein [Microbispora catharanthi]KAB8182538.1 YHS domain-containing protein [Microbispora catharanthi]